MFPYEEPLNLGEFYNLEEPLWVTAAQLRGLMEPYLTEERQEKIAEVIRGRTYQVVTVMEGLHDLGNVAAVLRSAEALGFQEAHVIDTQPKHKVSNRITQGADKWLDVHHWRDRLACVEELKRRGYSICVTHLEESRPVEEVDFTKPTALVLGNEMDGVTDEMVELADQRCVIPMGGFVESFNISVAAALILYEAARQRRERLGGVGDLTEEQQRVLEALWYVRSVPKGDRLVQELWRRSKSEEVG